MATTSLKEYNTRSKNYINTLRLVPGIGLPQDAQLLNEFSTTYSVAEATFQHASHELALILGSELTFPSGTRQEMLARDTIRIQDLK
jgi:hypothetical protein